MIEITHQQARRLIRMALDSHPEDRSPRRGSRISDEQWGILQAHLESCPACCAYQARLNEMESSLRRILRSRWGGIAPVRLDGLPADWENRRDRRRLWTGRAARFGIWAAAALALLLLIRGPALLSGEGLVGGRESTQVAALPSPTPTPTPKAMFRGVVAYETQSKGNREIYLLNALGGPQGPQAANLTNHTAHDYTPAFSPDGEWIAFLSTRQEEDEQAEVLPKAQRLQAGTSPESAQQAETKPELYVVHLAGSRLTKLTDEPNIEWLGPLSWSSDGQWIALRGRRLDTGGQVYAYIVPLNPGKTQQARPLAAPDSLGLIEPPRFSPRGVKLAYQTAEHGVNIWNVAAGSLDTFPGPDGAVQDPENAPFQWFADGQSLAFGQAQAGSSPFYEIARADETSWEVLFSSVDDAQAAASGPASSPTSVSPSPAWGRIAFLLDPDADGCRTVHIMSDKKPAPKPREITGLCIDGPVEPDSWTTDGRWLVLPAHEPGDEAHPGIYAISTLLSPPGWPFERLGNLPAWGEQEQPPRVSVRPESAPLDIQPLPAPTAGSAPPVTALSNEIPGTILVMGQQPPAGGSGPLPEILTPSAGEMVSRSLPLPPGIDPAGVYCPVLSPGGELAAVVVNDPAIARLHMLIVDREGRLVTEIQEDPEAGIPSAGCPVWSPDGKSIAVVLTRITGPSVARIAVYGIDGSVTSLVPERAIRSITGLFWSPDSRRLYLYSAGLQNDKLKAWDVYEPPPDPESPDSALVELLPDLPNNVLVLDPAVSPDGSQIALLLLERTSPPRARLQVYSAADMLEQSRLELAVTRLDRRPAALVAWTPDGQVAFVRAADPASGHTAEVVFFDPAAQTERTAALLEDSVYAAAWSPDRRWLAYANESGLWLLDLRSPHSPAHIRRGEITAIDWQ